MTTTQAQQQVLVEHFGAFDLTLDEATEGRLFVEGKCGHAGQATANRRTYPIPIMEREIKKLNKRIAEGYPVLGSLDHPSDGKSRLKDASHIIQKVWMEQDGTIKMRAEVMEETENGKIAAAIVRRTKKIGMSSRGMGSTSPGPDGRETVNEDYKLATFDFVADPAVSDAYPVKLGEDVDAASVTPEGLRLTFPEQIEALEENARLSALQTIQQASGIGTGESREEIVQKAIDEYKDQIAPAVYQEARSSLIEEFGVKLVRSLQEMREDIEREVRAELASDPAEASAKATLAKIAESLVPFRPAADVQTLLDAKDREIEDLNLSQAQLERRVEESETTTREIALRARTAAFEAAVLRQVAGREDADRIVEMVGDVSKIETADELRKKLNVALEQADAVKSEANRKVDAAEQAAFRRLKKVEAREKRLRKQVEERDSKIASHVESITSKMQERLRKVEEDREVLLEQNNRLTGALERAETLIERLDDYNYASQRTVGHPSRDSILEDVRRGRVSGRRGINEIAEDSDLRGEEPGGVSERVRRALSRGREFSSEPLAESQEKRGVPDLEAFGIHVDDILPLSRGNRG